MILPSIPLPPPILSSTPGTWSYDTMSRRANDEILQRTFEENKDFFKTNPEAYKNFMQLRDELKNSSTIRFLLSQGYEDEEDWREILEPYVLQKKTWLSAPWLVTEFYLYRRILEAIGYFNKSCSNTYQKDLFERQKHAGISSVSSVEGVLERVSGLKTFSPENLSLMMSISLWGNQMDLSIWPTGSDNRENALLKVIQTSSENLLWDDTDDICRYCSSLHNIEYIDIVVDNAGIELVTDLILAEYLITSNIANQIRFRLKSFPTFVSDAMEKDLRFTVEYYSNIDSTKYPYCHEAGKRWKQFLESGKFVCLENNFWVQPKPMWDIPLDLKNEITKSSLTFIKGDANYRRLLGDRQWEFAKHSFQNVVGDYFPTPVVALRTLKAEIGCGMKQHKIDRAKSIDKNWLVNGKFGVIQLGVPPNTKCNK